MTDLWIIIKAPVLCRLEKCQNTLKAVQTLFLLFLLLQVDQNPKILVKTKSHVRDAINLEALTVISPIQANYMTSVRLFCFSSHLNQCNVLDCSSLCGIYSFHCQNWAQPYTYITFYSP